MTRHPRRQPTRAPIAAFFLVAAVLIALAGCSYFNAFYNTQRSFNEAEAERERSTDLQARPAGYNDAVEAGARLIEMYPDSKWIDDALFIMGQAYYWLEDYHKARRKFEELHANYPESPFIEESRMWLGKVMVQLKKRQEATSLLRGLIADTDDPALIGESRFALAELYYVDSSFVKAAEEFARTPDVSAEDKLIGRSLWRAGESLYRVKRYADAAEYLKQALNHELTPTFRFRARLLYGECLRESGRAEQALQIFNDMLKDKRYFEEHGRVRVQKGLALIALGRREQAFEEWRKTIDDYSRSEAAARAYYEMGVVHLNTAGEREQAKEMFDKARVEKARTRYAMKADTMLTMLNRVDQLLLDRKRTSQRISLTEEWVENPINPADTSEFAGAEYYDSLAIDSLKLARLWSKAWRDSVVTREREQAPADSGRANSADTTLAADSLAAGTVAAGADSSLASPVPDTVAAAGAAVGRAHADSLRPPGEPAGASGTREAGEAVSPRAPGSLDPFAEYRHQRPESDTIAAARPVPAGVENAPADSTIAATAPAGERPEAAGADTTAAAGARENVDWRETLAKRLAKSDGAAEKRDALLGSQQRAAGLNAAGLTEAAPETVETFTLFDTQPVLDSLAQMRAELQEAHFQLGEIQLFDLRQPDSAAVIFRELTGPENADSVRARAYSVLAYISREAGDTTRADSLLRHIAAEFPTTRTGRRAVEKLGLEQEQPVTSAEIEYAEAESLFVREQDYQEAYSRYRWISETYPSSTWAPRALYAAAYISGTHLDDGETAEALMTRVIEDYPETPQARRAREKISAYDAIRYSSEEADTVGLETQFAEFDALSEEEVDEPASIVGGIEALSATLDARNLLPQKVIQGTGGEVLLRFIINTDQQAGKFRIVMENPPGQGLGRALIAGLEEVTFRAAVKDGEPVATKVERRYTLPLDAPPNVRPLPR